MMVPTATVSGVLSRQDSQPLRGVLLTAIRSTRQVNLGLLELPPRGNVNASGEFSLSGLQPGTYLLTARAPSAMPAAPAASAGRGGPPPAPTVSDLWALVDLTITGEDISNLRLELAPGMNVSGRIRFEGATPPPVVETNSVFVSMSAPPGTTAALGVGSPEYNADGTFQFRGVAPGTFLANGSVRTPTLSGGLPTVPTWVVKSATLGGRDVLDAPFEVRPGLDVSSIDITFTDRVTQVTGLVTDQAGRPAPANSVIVFSVDPKFWRQGSRWVRQPARPASDGRFTIAGMPPGEYYLAMVTDFQPTEWYTPGFLQQVVPGAIRITLGEGEKRTQDLKLAGG